MKKTLIIICIILMSCGGSQTNKKQAKIDDLIKKRTDVELAKKTYVDSITAMSIPDDKFLEYNKEYNRAKNFNETPKIPSDLNRLWKKIDELTNDIEAYNENVLQLSKEINESKSK